MNTNPVPQIAFDFGYHKMTSFDMATDLRKRIAKIKPTEFEAMKSGDTYLYDVGCKKEDVFVCINVTKSGKQANVEKFSHVNESRYADRIHTTNYSHGKLLNLSAAGLAPLLGVRHKDIVEAALADGNEAPVLVRREYPDLYVDTPDRFATDHPRNSGADRVKSALEIRFKKVLAAKDFFEIIESHHRDIRLLIQSRNQAVHLNPAVATDFDRYVDDHRCAIDFYRWLIPHVSPGGVFFIQGGQDGSV